MSLRPTVVLGFVGRRSPLGGCFAATAESPQDLVWASDGDDSEHVGDLGEVSSYCCRASFDIPAVTSLAHARSLWRRANRCSWNRVSAWHTFTIVFFLKWNLMFDSLSWKKYANERSRGRKGSIRNAKIRKDNNRGISVGFDLSRVCLSMRAP